MGHRLAIGAFWSLTGTVVSRALGLVSSVVVARLLGREGFGELGMVVATTAMFQAFAGLGLGMTATTHVAAHRDRDRARAGRIMGLTMAVALVAGVLCSGALVAGAPWLAEHQLAAPHLAGPLRLSAGMLLLGAVNGAQMGSLAGLEAFKGLAWTGLVGGILNFVFVIPGVVLGGVDGVILGMTASLVSGAAVNHVVLRREARARGIQIDMRALREEWPVLWGFSIPAFLSGLMVTPVNWACSAMLTREPGGYGELGAFNAANQWFNALLFLPGVLGQVVLPALSERIGSGEKAGARRLLVLSLQANGAIATALVAVLGLASPYVMALYGQDFEDAWPTLVVVVLTAGLVAVQNPVGQLIAAAGRMWVGFFMNAGWAVAAIVLTQQAVRWGAVGLATARLGAYVLHSGWVFWFAFRQLARPADQRPAPAETGP